ncbi:MAG: sugar transferase [Fimbriimonadaceae bacterium]|nr:sugar transferase [Fimbriimonadaceae bacterium]
MALIVLGPLMLVVALWIALSSPGGALFRQTRIGKNCETFTILKFRSMVAGADQIGSFRTNAGDARITSVGKFIRKTSIDELPQLINVIKGEMSIVGPRPDTPKQEGDYTPEAWRERHRVRPGITGLAQATLRSAATPEERLNADLKYASEASVGLDLHIIALTLRQVLARRGTN